MSVTLRTATPADLDAIVQVFLGCWRTSYASVLPSELVESMTDGRARAMWQRALTSTDGVTIVAEVDGHVRGVTRHSRDCVHSLYVDPAAQGQRLGTRLLDAAVASMRAGGATRLRLWVFADNAPSIAFYRSRGWLPDGTTRVQPEFGQRELRLCHGGAAGLLEHGDQSPTAALVGVRCGDERWVDAAGASEDVWVDLASVTKVVGTTTALVALWRGGRLEPELPVVEVLPGFAGHPGTTIRDLAEHRAGLVEWQPFYLAGPVRSATPKARRQQALELVAAMPPKYPLRAGRHYSDLGFMLLGEVVATVHGTDLPTAIRELVAEPHGVDLRFGPLDAPVLTTAPDDRVERTMVATGDPYPTPFRDEGFAWRDEPIRGAVNDGNCFHALDGVAGHAGLFARMDDLLCLLEGLAADERNRELLDGSDPGQGFGWRRGQLQVAGRRHEFLWHHGFTGVGVGFVPGEPIALAMACNRLMAADPQSTTVHWHRLLDAVLGEQE